MNDKEVILAKKCSNSYIFLTIIVACFQFQIKKIIRIYPSCIFGGLKHLISFSSKLFEPNASKFGEPNTF